jgi:hypothetical protein
MKNIKFFFQVYMKNKPAKWGVKVWALAGQSGYIHRFHICGDNLQHMTEEQLENLEPGIGASGQTVLSLVQDIPPGSELFFDNYFASPALLLKLK